jgi:hypothetical protein
MMSQRSNVENVVPDAENVWNSFLPRPRTAFKLPDMNLACNPRSPHAGCAIIRANDSQLLRILTTAKKR